MPSIPPAEYYTSAFSGPEMDTRFSMLGNTPQQALANLGAGVRPGLGINLGFRINQRGQSRYTANGYTVDGWKAQLINLTSGSVEFKDPGVTITASGDSNGYLDIMQYLEEPLFGRTLTFSVLYEDGTFLTITGTAPSEIPASNTTFANQMYDKGGIWLRMSSAGKVYVQIRTQAGCATSPVYAKPEEGADQTLAYKDEDGNWHLLPQPDADYTTQLLRCQRYRAIFGDSAAFVPVGIGQARNVSLISVSVPIPVSMRATPVASISGGLTLRNGETSIVCNSVSVDVLGPSSVLLNAYVSGAAQGAVYDAYIMPNDFLTLDANL